MPIAFNCACGRTLRVPDASAGKRARCPVCSAVVTVPEPEPVFEIVVPPLPPEPEPPPVEVPKPYGKPRYDEDEDATPYEVLEPEKTSSALDNDGNARTKGALPNFNKGRKNYG